jgi:hypothetical protein
MPDRREFNALAVTAAAMLAAQSKGRATVHTIQPGIKLCAPGSCQAER